MSEHSLDPISDRAEVRYPLNALFQAARMYYVDGDNQAQIATAMKISRPFVSRLLAEARRVGVVRIEVVNPEQHSMDDLAATLRDALGLARVYLAPGDQSARIRGGLALQVNAALADMSLGPGDVLLVSSGRTVYELSQGPLPRLPGVVIAPTVGGQTEPEPWHQSNELARTIAERSGGVPAFLFAQALPSPEMYESLQRDPSFQRVQRLWDAAKGALVAIGSPPASRQSISRFIPTDDDSLLRSVGDVCLNFFDTDGAIIQFPGSERMVNTSVDVLRGIPFTVGVAVGAEKVPSISSGAKAGFFRRLITDTATATAVLEHLRR